MWTNLDLKGVEDNTSFLFIIYNSALQKDVFKYDIWLQRAVFTKSENEAEDNYFIFTGDDWVNFMNKAVLKRLLSSNEKDYRLILIKAKDVEIISRNIIKQLNKIEKRKPKDYFKDKEYIRLLYKYKISNVDLKFTAQKLLKVIGFRAFYLSSANILVYAKGKTSQATIFHELSHSMFDFEDFESNQIFQNEFYAHLMEHIYYRRMGLAPRRRDFAEFKKETESTYKFELEKYRFFIYLIKKSKKGNKIVVSYKDQLKYSKDFLSRSGYKGLRRIEYQDQD